MDEAHALALLKDIQSLIDANRNDLKRLLDRTLAIEASGKLLKRIIQTRPITLDLTEKTDDKK